MITYPVIYYYSSRSVRIAHINAYVSKIETSSRCLVYITTGAMSVNVEWPGFATVYETIIIHGAVHVHKMMELL